MARKSHISSLKQMGEINLTPLMDLTFILLITFIITFPLIEQGIAVKLPKGDANPLTPEKARTVSVDKSGVIHLDNVPIKLEDLKRNLMDLGRATPDVTVMVRADERIQYGRVMDILKILHEAKIGNMALVTEAEKR